MPGSPALPIPVTEKVSPRPEAAIARLHRAMHEIVLGVRQNEGIYPRNYGRVTQSELCRRADVKKATLQNSLHKDTTRVEITDWLDGLNAILVQTRTGVRERVTECSDGLRVELEMAAKALQAAEANVGVLQHRLREMEKENGELIRQCPKSSQFILLIRSASAGDVNCIAQPTQWPVRTSAR